MTDIKQSLHDRIDRRMKQLQKAADRLHRMVDTDQLGGEEGRVWLEKFCVGKGIQVAGGDFIIGDSINIDPMSRYIAPDILSFWDEVPFKINVDYVITNYFDALYNPVRVLNEWYGQLNPNGVVAIVCRNADTYSQGAGPLENKKRVHCFTPKTLRFYLVSVGFEIIEEQTPNQEIWMAAKKP